MGWSDNEVEARSNVSDNRSELDARLSEGANLIVIETRSLAEFTFKERANSIWLASAVQVYLDLLRGGGFPIGIGSGPIVDLSGRVMMLKPLVLAVGIALHTSTACAQDVAGVEVCTMEKSMVRRTSCLQSNVDFLQKLISKNASDSQQKLDAANRAIDDLKSAVAILQKSVSQLQAAEKERK
jgi:hypothetical protein